ncbi:hypothetical protein [Shewanella salipaludis]|uniref:Uncharacterized protein n=1 Tax=Shewanella salipaludis TaxID=2723052 RepID=A0A972FUY5_9GAMM|nr:hypothetical protein [Shewanella salipaludis]NMH66588.1 hypothetical protein [Shewanella salipaludis]
MSMQYRINVTNKSSSTQSFFFFQAQGRYKGDPTVYSNSLYQASLPPSFGSGAVLTFEINAQPCAGAQTQVSAPTLGRASGSTTACQPIELATASGANTNDCTYLSVSPLGLSTPEPASGVQAGAFRIVAPVYNPNTVGNFNIGLAMQDTDGGPAIISNFVVAQPNQSIDCQPVSSFYVQVGKYAPGQIFDFASESISAARCDMSMGYTSFNVVYNVDGTWAVMPAK